MTENNVLKLAQPGSFTDSLTEILRGGAHALLKQAVEAEVADFLHRHADLKTEAGRRRVVRDGHWSGGCAPAAHTRPRGQRGRARSVQPEHPAALRAADEEPGGADPLSFTSRGISTGDFEEVLAALVGKDAPGLSASTIGRLKEMWTDEHERWQKRDLSTKRTSTPGSTAST
jgi:hypothetical protein